MILLLQGHDLAVLQSFGEYLDVVEAGVIECARRDTTRLYEEGAVLSDIVRFLGLHGRSVFDVICNDAQCNEVKRLRIFDPQFLGKTVHCLS